MRLPRTILVPTDFSQHADQAVAYAVELAARLDATLHLLHVVTVPMMTGLPEVGTGYAPIIDAASKDAQRALDELADRYGKQVAMAPPRIEVGDARDIIDRTAEQIGADLIVMGTHGRRGVSRFLLGSVAESVVRSAPCPVLTTRRIP